MIFWPQDSRKLRLPTRNMATFLRPYFNWYLKQEHLIPHHPHTTETSKFWDLFFHRSCFLVCFFSVTSILFESKTKIVHARKTNLELDKWIPKRISFSNETPPFSGFSRSFFGRLLAVFNFVGNLHPPENAPIPGRWTVVWVVTSNISIIAAQSLHQ